MQRDIDLLHFGMGKCMSTSLQNFWRQSNNVEFVETRPLSHQLNNTLVECLNKGVAVPPIQLDVKSSADEKPVIVSNEEFTFSFISSPKLAPLLPVKQELVAAQLQHRARRLLLMVRSPVAWVQSAHAQRIHQGGSESLAEFLTVHRNLILHMTNVQRFLSYWREAWDRLVVVPIEMFRSEPDKFWAVYSEDLDLPEEADKMALAQRNSTNYDRLETRAQLNKALEFFELLIAKSSDNPHAPYAPPKQKLVRVMNECRVAGVRRALAVASPEEFEVVRTHLNLTHDEGFFHALFDDQLKAHLQQNFIDALRCFPYMQDWIASYEYELAHA